MRVSLNPMISPSSLPAFSTPAISPLPRTPGGATQLAANTPAANRAGAAAPAPSAAPLSRTSPRGSLLDLSV